MHQITWDNAGERFYEVGVDRGVLFSEGKAVPWVGLVSITESPSGGEPQDYFVDGVKYLSIVGQEEFGATIEAYTYPSEFSKCDGTSLVKNGLFVSQQNRVPFSLSYRTKIGNEIDGPDHAYKLHLVYNATAAPSERQRSTIGESVEASLFSWGVTTTPPPIQGYKATAHFEIDSRQTPPALMRALEDILYGQGTVEPRLPVAAELINMFQTYVEPDPGTDTPVPPGTDVVGGAKPGEATTISYDGGTPTSTFEMTVDGGSP